MKPVRYALAAMTLIVFSFSCFAQSDIDYFKGTWTVAVRGGPAGGFKWEVKPGLDGSWLAGSVTREGRAISNDYWRQDGKRIERFAFSSNGLFIKVSSAGWNGNQLVFTGTGGSAGTEFNVRETLTKIDPKKFSALWERQEADGKWIVFSDETCTK